jgi:hypothetical protein
MTLRIESASDDYGTTIRLVGPNSSRAPGRVAGTDQPGRVKDCVGLRGGTTGGHRGDSLLGTCQAAGIDLVSTVRRTSANGLARNMAQGRKSQGNRRHPFRTLNSKSRLGNKHWIPNEDRSQLSHSMLLTHPSCLRRTRAHSFPFSVASDWQNPGDWQAQRSSHA